MYISWEFQFLACINCIFCMSSSKSNCAICNALSTYCLPIAYSESNLVLPKKKKCCKIQIISKNTDQKYFIFSTSFFFTQKDYLSHCINICLFFFSHLILIKICNSLIHRNAKMEERVFLMLSKIHNGRNFITYFCWNDVCSGKYLNLLTKTWSAVCLQFWF